MSWTVSVNPRKAPAIYDAIDAAEPSADVSDESLEQVHAAKGAAKTLIQSGAFGDPVEKAIGCTLSGHANPGHVPAKGMANDQVSISISQGKAS